MSALTRESPAVRGRFMQTFLRQIRKLPEADAASILAAIGPARLASIDAASMLAWLPMETNLVATRAVAARLVARETHEFFRALQHESFTTPILSGLVNGILRVLGRNPHVAFRWVGKGYGTTFRSVGEWAEANATEKALTLELRKLPPAVLGDRVWLHSVSSALHAVLDIADVEGAVTLQGIEEKASAALFRARWA